MTNPTEPPYRTTLHGNMLTEATNKKNTIKWALFIR